ncbi:MAG: HD domain-containing protein [Myxococcaceae bacterium]|nr:HD domain-containing protein [Myxococcaceae bacterium]
MERFLIVDDDPSITDVLRRVLESMGHAVTVHNDPLQAAKETDFDLVVTDYMMPNLNGVELLAVLRAKRPDAVRLLITAAHDFKVAIEAVNRGEVFRIIGKPWQLHDLRFGLQQAVDYYRLVQENRRLTRELADRNQRLASLNAVLEQQVTERTNGLLEGMIRALDYRDTETQWHSWRVAKFTRRIAEAAGLAGDVLVHIEQGALLHDIGKIGVTDSILLKPGKLTPDEWVEMRKHPEMGYRMLANIPYLQDAAQIVFQHQERWDGRGYPRALKGEEIVIGARIFCIADTFDAITSDRPYRKGSPAEVAIAEIGRLGGTQLDPNLVQTFLAIPMSEWERIRAEISALEDKEKGRWDEYLVAPAPLMGGQTSDPPKAS